MRSTQVVVDFPDQKLRRYFEMPRQHGYVSGGVTFVVPCVQIKAEQHEAVGKLLRCLGVAAHGWPMEWRITRCITVIQAAALPKSMWSIEYKMNL